MTLFYPDQDQYPYNAVVFIRVKWSDGSYSRGSGAMVGQNDVLTASHMVYAPGKTVQDIDIYPAYDGIEGPWGSFTSGTWKTNYYPVGSADGTISQQGSAYDLALIGLSDSLGSRTGWLGLHSDAPSEIVEVVGFPAAQGTRLTADEGYAAFRNGTYDISGLYHAPGSSGGPLLDASHAVVGVVSSTLYADRIDDEWGTLTAWMAGNDTLLATTAPVVNPLIQGTSGADNLTGSDGADTILGDAGNDTLSGAGGSDRLDGGTGDDLLSGGAGNDTLLGGDGLDTAILAGLRRDFAVTPAGATWSVRHLTSDDTDSLDGMERLQFLDGVLALDITGHAGQAYRLYLAAFARLPDTAGLKYQTQALDTGLWLNQVASNFIASPEFQARYGTPDTVSDAQFVTLLYNNVLHRAPEQAGYEYHMAHLAHGLSRGDLLSQFSESPESQANLLPSLQGGIWLG